MASLPTHSPWPPSTPTHHGPPPHPLTMALRPPHPLTMASLPTHSPWPPSPSTHHGLPPHPLTMAPSALSSLRILLLVRRKSWNWKILEYSCGRFSLGSQTEVRKLFNPRYLPTQTTTIKWPGRLTEWLARRTHNYMIVDSSLTTGTQ